MLDCMELRPSGDRILTLAVPVQRAAMARDHIPEILKLMQQAGAGHRSISIIEVKPRHDDTEKDGAATVQPAPDLSDQTSHPLVKEAARVFGARVVHIEPKRPR